MLIPKLISALALGVFCLGCDDTGKAIQQEVKEIDEEQVKRDLKQGAATVGSAADKLVKKTEEAIDKVDKKAAEEIRKE